MTLARGGTVERVRVRWTAIAVIAIVAFAPAGSGAQDTTRARLVSDTIRLPEAIRIALEQNSLVRFARNDLTLDSLTVRLLRKQFFPNLAASSSSSQGFGSRSQNDYALGIGASSGVTVYNGLQNVNALRQARFQYLATGHELGRTQQTIVFLVASEFLTLVTQQEQARVQRENLAAQEEELTQLEAFVQAGTRPIGDLYQQQAAVASTRLALVNARRAVELAKVDLMQELVLDPTRDYTFETPSLMSDSATTPAFDLDSLMRLALERRVDVQAQKLRVQAAEREIAIAAGSKLPVISATGGYNSAYSTANDGSIASQLDQRRGGSIGVGISVPIFDRGVSSFARQQARIQLHNALLTLRDLGQAVALDVRRAYLDYQAAQEQIIASAAQQRAAALALEAVQARYRVGAATFVEVTLARATLIEAQSAVVSARSSLSFQRALMSYYTGMLDLRGATLGS